MRRLLYIVAAWLYGGVAVAQVDAVPQVSVFSPRADTTSVTIYRDGIALITETRTVELPAEAATVVFQGVVDSLLPQSAVMTGAGRPFASTDYHFDQLTPATLLQRSVGKTVALVRTNRKTGRVTRTEVKVVSAGRGVVLQALDGSEALHCAGTPEYLELSEVPSELNTKAVLSVRLAAGAAGKREIKLSYLARGFSWSSDYVARLNDAANRMALTGWVTLENHTSSSFDQAQVQVVAGNLNLLAGDEGGSAGEDDPTDTRAVEAQEQMSLLSQCFPLGTTTSDLPREQARTRPRVLARENENYYFQDSPLALSAISVTPSRATRENLGDYQLYRLPWLTDLHARQTKQVVFLEKPAVKVERFYRVYVAWLDADTVWPQGAPNLILSWGNEEKNGLGEPLPAGMVRVFEPRRDGEVFAGEAPIMDTPVGLPNELAIASAMNLTSDYTLDSRQSSLRNGRTQLVVQATHHFTNNKEAPVTLEVRHATGGSYSVPVVGKSNHRAGRKYGDVAWRFAIPAGAQDSLSYELRATELP